MHSSDDAAARQTCPRPYIHAPQHFSTSRTSKSTSAADHKGHDIVMELSPHPLLSENSAEKALYRVCTDFTLSLESVERQGRQQPPDLLFTGMIDRSTYYSAILSTFSKNCPLLRLELQHIFQDQALPVRIRLWDHAQSA